MLNALHSQPHILVTDPVYVSDAAQFAACITEASPSTTKLSVKVPVSDALLASLEAEDDAVAAQIHLCKELDETVFLFGKQRPSFRDYDFLGWHVSESGLCCLTRPEPPEEAIDRFELMLTALQEPMLRQDRGEFPQLLWFSRTPEDAACVRVYGCDRRADSGEYEGLLLRQGRGNDDV